MVLLVSLYMYCYDIPVNTNCYDIPVNTKTACKCWYMYLYIFMYVFPAFVQWLVHFVNKSWKSWNFVGSDNIGINAHILSNPVEYTVKTQTKQQQKLKIYPSREQKFCVSYPEIWSHGTVSCYWHMVWSQWFWHMVWSQWYWLLKAAFFRVMSLGNVCGTLVCIVSVN